MKYSVSRASYAGYFLKGGERLKRGKVYVNHMRKGWYHIALMYLMGKLLKRGRINR